MRIWFVRAVMLLVFMSGAFAGEVGLPYQCKAIPVTEATVKLAKSSPSVVLINNISEVDLWVTHPISEPSASAGWSSRLQTKHWSALALGADSFELGCIESKPGHEQQIPCSGSLVVCQWPGLTSTDKQKAPFWAGENMELPELLAHLGQRGFKIPEPAQRQ